MTEWIRVEDDLPPEDVPVFVVPKAWPEEITAAVLAYEDGWHWEELNGWALTDRTSYSFDDDYEYTHWMKMPDLPNTKKKATT